MPTLPRLPPLFRLLPAGLQYTRVRHLALLACVAGCALLLAPTEAHADSLSTFALDGSGSQSLSGASLDVTLSDLEIDGVSFDAVLSVSGSAALTQSSSGLGVSGGSSLINAGEWIRFTLVTTNVSGGIVRFLGFDRLDFTFFTAAGEEALLSLDADPGTACDNFLTAYAPGDDPLDLSGYRPLAFSLFGVDGFGEAGGTVSFRVDSIDAAFSAATPVPEPGSLLLVFAAGMVCVWRRRARSRRRHAASGHR